MTFGERLVELRESRKISRSELAEMLGHANASTTMNVYTHLREKQERSAAAMLDEYLAGT